MDEDDKQKERWLGSCEAELRFNGLSYYDPNVSEGSVPKFTDAQIVYQMASLRLRLEQVTEEVQKTIDILVEALNYGANKKKG